jgi:hypothetical protein
MARMGVTSTGSQEEGGRDVPAGPQQHAATDTKERFEDALTAGAPSAADQPTSHLEPAAGHLEPPAGHVDPPTASLLVGSLGERCANCGAPLASDQRYCVQCGERRGTSRFSTATMSAPAATTPSRTAGPPPERHRSWSSGTTLIAGIATLLLALGVGVLIGKAGNNSTPKAQAPEVITVNGGGSSATGAGATSAGATGAVAGGASAGSTHHSASKPAHTTPKTEATKAKAAAKSSKPTTSAVKKASHAASSVLGGGASQQNNTVTTGSSCKAGSAGCQNGHFTGGFFGQ